MWGDVMKNKISNLVFEGGGVLGIAYLGVLDYLYKNKVFQDVKRVAGTSAGSISACICSFNLPFDRIKSIIDTLDYSKVPTKDDTPELKKLPKFIREEFEKIFGDIDCIYRLVKKYGWYSSEYFYDWIKEQIEMQFDKTKKLPPYTFRDFKNSAIHKDKRTFLDLYIIGTDMSYKCSKVFSYKTTPDMEVAESVRISMSIPLFFEANKVDDYDITRDNKTHIFSDGGIMRNYPINIFDSEAFEGKRMDNVNMETLGSRFKTTIKYKNIDSLLMYIENLFSAFTKIQVDTYENSPLDIKRSIEIDTKSVSFVDFNIKTNDDTYNFLYQQGYKAAENYFRRIC
jgi:NTE family protein